MTAEQTLHQWSKDALLNKTQRYVNIMLKQDREEWQFGFWSSLSLEMLIRTTLSNISPTLLANGKDWNNIYFALGKEPNTTKFKPKSADISDLIKRTEQIFPEFNTDMLNFSISHMNRRNSELHSGELAFDSFGTSGWLSKYYSVCKVLLKTLNKDLAFLFGEDEANTAEKLIAALQDDAAKSVQKTINAHKTVWDGYEQTERDRLKKQGESLASRHEGHRVNCPACDSQAILHGTPILPPTKTIDDYVVTEKQAMLPSKFECYACGLKISGFSKLSACNLGDTFTGTNKYEVFEIDEDAGYEPDYNEF